MIKKFRLTKEQQESLLHVIKDGIWKTDNKILNAKAREAKRLLLFECQPVVKSISEYYIGRKGFGLEGLIIIGNKGLEKAMYKWVEGEVVRKYSFIKYSMWFIRAAIHRRFGLPTDPERYREKK